MSNLQTALADAGYEMVDADLIELLKAKQAEGTLSAAEAELLSQLEALGIDLEIAEGEALSAEDLQALGDAQVSLPSPASAPFASGGLGGLAALGAMGGGGGGGGTAVATVSSSLQGQLINGYIQGAKVFQDIDGDGEHDDFEPFSFTDAEGSFALDGYVAGGGELIAATDSNTRDVTTDAEVTTEFKLDLDSGFDTSGGVVISPLSTLLAEDPELTEETLKTKLGIASDINLLNYDPIEAAQTDSDPSAALQFKAVSTQISNLLDIGASTLSTATGQDKVDVMAGVISSVVEKIKTEDAVNIDFADATFLANTIDEAATAVGATADQISAMSSVTTAATQKLEELNDKIEQAVSNPDATLALSEMYKAAKVAQEDLEANIDQVLADPTQLESLLNQFDVDTAVTEVDIPAVNLISNSTFDNAVGWSGDGLGITENGTSLANVAEAGQSYWVNLQYGLPITQGEDYTLTFQARGTEGRDLIAGIGLNEDPWTNDTENLTLTEGWKTYTLNLSSASFGSENSRVFFDMGHDVGEVEIDNVSLSLGATEIADPSVDATNYTLVFEDNFDEIGQGPSADDWTFDLGTGAPNLVGWGNNEVQSYENGLDDAVIVDGDPTDDVNGALQITAQKDGDTITSARVKTALDLDPYGYYEVRAKLPSEAGAWPAIWLLGNDDTWPNAGEIDLVEWSAASNAATATRDENDDTIISALHYPDAHAGTANSTTHTLDTAVDEWHTYQAWWTPDYIAVGVDGTLADAHLVYERPANADNDAWPFDGGMDLIMNIAIGGTLGGTVPANDFSYNMLIDYVKIYQAGTLPESPGPVEEDDSSDVSGNLLADGTFSAASSSGWSGNAYNPVDGINRADIATAGNPWDVNLSGSVELTADQSYTVTFDAKGTAGRTILAGIGDAGSPYASDTEELTLSAEWQTFTLHLDSTGFSGASRVLFDMGADTGAVDIDNVSVVDGHVGTENLNEPVVNLLTDGAFSATDTSASGWSGNAYNPVDGINVANVATAGNAYDVNLSGAVELTAGQSYTVTFDAKGTAGRTILAGIGDAGSPYASDTEELTLSAEWQTFTLHLDSTGFSGASRVLFDMGADTGAVDIDNVSVVDGHVGTENLNEPVVNLLTDGAFSATDTSASGWSGNAYNPVDGVNVANVATAGNAYDVNLSGAVELTADQSYTVTFDAKGTAGRTILAGIGDAGSPYASDTEELTLSAEWQTFTLHLDSTGFSGASRVLFDMGADTGAVDIDNVSVVAGHVGTENLNEPSSETATGGGSDVNVYDATEITHQSNDAEVASAAQLTITAVSANVIEVSVTSSNDDPVDLVTIGAMDDAAGLSQMELVDGVASIQLTWPDGAPATTSFEVLWSKASTEGNWMLTREQLGTISTSQASANGGDSDPVNLLTDGTFSATDTNASGWSGNAYNPVDGVNVANVATAGNAYDVNLSGSVELTAGQSYTVTFDAKGTDGRTLIAGIGDAQSPWNNDTETLTLSDEWQTYTLHLDSTGFSGASRVLFDMGADTGAVDIDNVSVFAGQVGTENLNEPESTASGTSSVSQLVITFEADDDSGFALESFGGNASEVLAASNAPAGSDGQVAKITKVQGQTWAGTTFIDLDNNGNELISDGNTTVTIDVFSATQGATVRLKLEDSQNGNAAVELDQTTTTSGSWETLTWDFSSADHSIDFDKASIFFDFGNAGAGEEYYFDDVTFNGFIS